MRAYTPNALSTYLPPSRSNLSVRVYVHLLFSVHGNLVQESNKVFVSGGSTYLPPSRSNVSVCVYVYGLFSVHRE